MCWYCFWGLSEPVYKIRQKYVNLFEGDESPLDFGPGHAVWSDFNFDDDTINRCINKEVSEKEKERFSETTLKLVRDSLLELLEIPESIRDPSPKGEDGWELEGDYSKMLPPVGMVMINN